MPLLTYLTQFFRDLRSQKMRTFLTIFGIMWGTTSVVLLLAFGKGLQAQNQKSMRGLGESIVIMWGGRTSLPFEGFNRGRSINMREEDAAHLRREIPELGGISPEYSRWSTPMKYKQNAVTQNLVGIYPVFSRLRNIYAEMGGRFINQVDIDKRKRVVFVGDELRKDLFGEDQPIGKYMLINNIPFLVIGVMIKKDQDSNYSGPDQNKAFIPATTYSAIFGDKYIDNMVFKAGDPRQTELVKSRVYEVLGNKYRFNPDDKEALAMWDTTEMEKFMTYFFLAFRIFLAVIGTFTLIVGGIGVANIMYIVVEERSREIGIKMSLGAKNWHIMSQFIIETLTVTCIGGLIGFLFALFVVKIFPSFNLEEYVGVPTISPLSVLVTVGVLGTVGLVSGIFPARKAANLNPVQALKL